MKKLALILGSILIAGYSHGASINWSMSNISSSGGSAAVKDGYVGYFFIVDATAATPVTVESISGLLDDGEVASAIGLATYSKGSTYNEKNNVGLINSSANPTDLAGGTSVTGFAVVFDAPTASAAQHYFVTGEVTKTLAGNAATSFAFLSQADAVYKPLGGTQPDIPEPATGALALAGVALLFRRRRA